MTIGSTPPHGGSRRQESPRAPLGLEVIFQAHGETPRLGTIEDLSGGGACIEASASSSRAIRSRRPLMAGLSPSRASIPPPSRRR